jgi:Putative peptidoglycan binding domain
VTAVFATDATTANMARMPAGFRVGYSTGPGIAWTTPQWQANPGALRTCQDAGATDATADVLDVENYAATVADCPGWVKRARAAYAAALRPGQREPCIYVNQSNIHLVANELLNAGVTGVVYLWLADYNYSPAAAAALVVAASGPYPEVGIQYAVDGDWDLDVFASSWLNVQSGVKGSQVQEGDSGPAVVALQKALNAADKAALTVDGLFGAATLAAVKAFQTAHKLTVDGIAGPATWSVLDAVPVTPPPPPPPPPVTVFAAPKDVAAGDLRLNVTWDAVPVVNGKKPTGYKISVYLVTGQHIGDVTVAYGTNVVTLGLALGRQYKIYVGALGGDKAAPTTLLAVNT